MAQRPGRVLAATCIALGALLGAGPALAADLYLQGNLHNAYGNGDGDVDAGLPGFAFAGRDEDRDTSPVYGVSGGLAFWLEEVNPDGWGADMPRLKLRMEVEWLGGRSYDFVTEVLDTAVIGQVDVWTFTPNLFVHVPLSLPLEPWMGRVPILEPLSFYAGGGLGVAKIEYESFDNLSEGSDSLLGFTWHAGAGIDYEVNEWIDLTLGYRYEDLGRAKTDLAFGSTPFGQASMDLRSTRSPSASAWTSTPRPSTR